MFSYSNKENKKAFTLIELLVVIAIIGLLATLSVIALNNAREKSRDAKRMSDIKQVQTALEMFFNDMNRYPTLVEWNFGSLYSTSSAGTTTYMATIPSAPSVADGNCDSEDNAYAYGPIGDDSYTIHFCTGGNTGSLDAGSIFASPGVLTTNFICGLSTVEYDGGLYDIVGSTKNQEGYYRTIQVGGQCWLRDNMNTGTMVTATSTDNSIVEKYCYSDSTSNCDIYGGLYQWDEAMQYSTSESAQGICPDGWHIPGDAEWKTLEMSQGMSQATADLPSWRGDDEGSRLAGNKTLWNNGALKDEPDFAVSNFDLLPAGYRNLDGTYGNLGYSTNIWSSLESGTNAWARYLYYTHTDVYRYTNDKLYGFAVRCLKHWFNSKNKYEL